MTTLATHQMVERIAGLMKARLGVRGATAAEVLRRGAGRLPRRLRPAARDLAEAAALAGNPRLALRLDAGRLADAYDRCLAYLADDAGAARRRTALGEIAAGVAVNLALAAAALAGFLAWRGLL